MSLQGLGLHLKHPLSEAEQHVSLLQAERNSKGHDQAARRNRKNELDRADSAIDKELAEIRHSIDHFPEPDEYRKLCERGRNLEAQKIENANERARIQPEIDAAEPAIELLDEDIEIADAELNTERLYALTSQLLQTVSASTLAITAFQQETERLAQLYPAHKFFPDGRRIPAHGGAPAIPRVLVGQLLDLTKSLCERLAEWRPELFKPGDLARARAEQIRRVEQQGSEAAVTVQRRNARLPPAPPMQIPVLEPSQPRDLWDVVAANDAAARTRDKKASQ